MIARLWRKLAGSRLVRNVGALGYGQVTLMVGQLLAVPVFASVWGLEVYGAWLLLFTLPSYLSMTDLGVTAAASNKMIMANATVEVAQRDAVKRTFATMRQTQFAVGVALVLGAALLLYVVAPGVVDFAQPAAEGYAREATLALVAYGAVSLQLNGLRGGLRATDRFAAATLTQSTLIAVELIIAVALVLLGFGILPVALGYLVVRLAGVPILSGFLRRAAPWMLDRNARFSLSELRGLARPSLAALALPLGTAMALQMMTVLVGARAGIAAVPIFTTVRTLTRLPFQITGLLSNAAMPLFGVAHSAARRVDQVALLILTVGTNIAVLVPTLGILALIGPEIVMLWTAGTIDPPRDFVIAMGVTMVLNGVWMGMATLLLSINRQEGYAIQFIVLSALALAIAWVLVEPLGPLGAALALNALDAVMVLILFQQTKRAGFLHRDDLRAGFAMLRDRVWGLIR
ncbi:lipopolysaccharide biosynthesis protein [Croceicoccus naphthovorans]|uniref:Uncharacterized protein n=1 Tax=Croceicoccus naphthovorans TaxID=1348774 RepID=A0A0G3XL21_9SPHN|nr:hypothetical protein [Croceicoccus naphthovorans]AKM11289.1 hypothetical protein AB433_16995 [Croceicoccus naphthovorans]MBB3989789.1 O-antigen/teichoic acid export membrane protein [Croceicoccus naphthovorans]